MPYRTKPKRRNALQRKKAQYNRKRALIRKLPIGGFPASMMVRLRYVNTFTLNAGIGSYAQQNYRANSIYDPDATGVGHSPSNYDRWTANYDRYTVIASEIKVYWVGTSGTAITIPPVISCCLSEDGNTTATLHGLGGIDAILQSPRMSYTRTTTGIPGSGTPTLITRRFSAKKFFKVKELIGKGLYSADIAANPTEGAFFEVAAISPDDTVDPTVICLRAEINYIAVMTEPKAVSYT